MKLLVLGASSFSGAAFAKYARALGNEVMELSRPEFDVNVNPERALMLARAGYKHVINFVALNMVAESWPHAQDYYRTNVAGVTRLADLLAKEGGLKKFVQVSTPEVYGTKGAHLREDAPFNPSTPYAVSRAAADWHLSLLHREFRFPVCFTRTVNVYGPGQQLYRIVPKTALCAMRGDRLPLHGGGVSTRSFIYVLDMAEANYRVLMDGEDGETYHVSTGRQTSIRALVGMVCERAGVKAEDVVVEAPERTGKDMAYQLDSTKIRTKLGWCDATSLETGLGLTMEWVKREFPQLAGKSLEYEHKA